MSDSFICKTPLYIDGAYHKSGDVIALPDVKAKPFLAHGVIEPKAANAALATSSARGTDFGEVEELTHRGAATANEAPRVAERRQVARLPTERFVVTQDFLNFQAGDEIAVSDLQARLWLPLGLIARP